MQYYYSFFCNNLCIFYLSGTFFVVLYHKIYTFFASFFQPIMIYRIAFSCDEVNRFRRVFEADSEATFKQVNDR